MEIIKKLNLKIDSLIQSYEILKKENNRLQSELNELKDKNIKLEKNNKDMLLKIDSSLTFIEARNIAK